MFSRVILLAVVSVFSVFLLLKESQAADEVPAPSTTQWEFLPDIGLEGVAHIADIKKSRFSVSCGNGGAPGFMLQHPSSPILTSGDLEQRIPLQLIIDDIEFEQIFSCYRGDSVCVSFGFPSQKLMSAMQRGNRMALSYKKSTIAEFTLVSSSTTIGRLSECLGVNRADYND